jgi:competence protein ComFB
MMDEHFVSKNISEELVETQLESCIQSSGVCGCERCRADIRALTLNAMQPRYVVTNLGDAFVRLDAMSPQSQADIITIIMNAIAVVKQNPFHEPA